MAKDMMSLTLAELRSIFGLGLSEKEVKDMTSCELLDQFELATNRAQTLAQGAGGSRADWRRVRVRAHELKAALRERLGVLDSGIS